MMQLISVDTPGAGAKRGPKGRPSAFYQIRLALTQAEMLRHKIVLRALRRVKLRKHPADVRQQVQDEIAYRESQLQALQHSRLASIASIKRIDQCNQQH